MFCEITDTTANLQLLIFFKNILINRVDKTEKRRYIISFAKGEIVEEHPHILDTQLVCCKVAIKKAVLSCTRGYYSADYIAVNT